MKRLAFAFAAIITTFVIAATGVATAQSRSGNPIWEGLWSGSNFSIGGTKPPTTPPPSGGHYAALGDSVAAGLGLSPLATPTDADTRCGRSSDAYAHQVAASQALPLTHIACSGAKMGDLVSQQNVSGGDMEPQLRAAFAGGVPALISITAGANDVHWNEFVYKCYVATCGTRADQRISDAYLAALRIKMRYALLSIEARSGGQAPTTIVTGYYNPLSSACTAVQSELSAVEIAWLSNRLTALNATLEDIAGDFSFVRFAPVDFTGHDICSADPWVQGQNDTAPFHPTAAGQASIAAAVLKALE